MVTWSVNNIFTCVRLVTGLEVFTTWAIYISFAQDQGPVFNAAVAHMFKSLAINIFEELQGKNTSVGGDLLSKVSFLNGGMKQLMSVVEDESPKVFETIKPIVQEVMERGQPEFEKIRFEDSELARRFAWNSTQIGQFRNLHDDIKGMLDKLRGICKLHKFDSRYLRQVIDFLAHMSIYYKLIPLLSSALLQIAKSDDSDLAHLKPIKPIFEELGLKEQLPVLEENIKTSILKEKNKTHNILHYMNYFHDKVNNVYNMIKNPQYVEGVTKSLIQKLLVHIRPWFDKNNFDDYTLRETYNLSKKEVENYHEKFASSKILLHLIDNIIKKNKKEEERLYNS